ncbi:HD domain-containing protein [Hymenobacter sp. BT491]|uniref:HD domain-containing protein n=1 Tax=Hymenobacter sp. BT491 TaxID=2766779 RepID=UPI0016536148|nr:HD domain-containing protein [Hymenobacter sp. BT491]MBC6989200.1 HD domain-containing protein [Hymenobacter sp. BT491]
MDCRRAETYVLNELRQHLSPTLYYHGLHHTLDVLAQAQSLAEAEGVTDAEALMLLRTAALYHDSGFMTTYIGHEEAGCELVKRTLPGMGYSADQIELICRLIMATKMPQNPGDLHLAQILCDADLDYLGRPDFWPISQTLYVELQARGMAPDEQKWNEGQVDFLQGHQYWTASATARREASKQARLAEAQARLK